MGLRPAVSQTLIECERVLVVRPDEIGDVVLTSPLLRELRRNLPDAWITLVVKPSVRNLVELCPYIDEVLEYDFTGWMRETEGSPTRREWVRRRRAWTFAAKRLWRRRFDLALMPRQDADYPCFARHVAYASGARWRAGYPESDRTRGLWLGDPDAWLTQKLRRDESHHEAERVAGLLDQLGGRAQESRLEAWFDARDEAAVAEFAKAGVGGPIALCPGAGHAKRVWPSNRYVELGSWLASERSARIVVIGGPGEKLLGEGIANAIGPGATSVAGHLTLRATAALLAQCSLFIGSDSGSMHLAAAAGIPVVEISCHPASGSVRSPNAPERFGPWGVPSRVVQPRAGLEPCVTECGSDEAHCIRQVGIEEVKEAAASLLEQTEARGIALPS